MSIYAYIPDATARAIIKDNESVVIDESLLNEDLIGFDECPDEFEDCSRCYEATPVSQLQEDEVGLLICPICLK